MIKIENLSKDWKEFKINNSVRINGWRIFHISRPKWIW